MGKAEMTREQWYLAHFVAANLALRRVSKNLVLGLREYLLRYPDERPSAYLARHLQLGKAFAGGDDELRQRQELLKIVRKTEDSAGPGEWPLILSWVARLMVSYRPEDRGEGGRADERAIKGRISSDFAAAANQLEGSYYG